MQMLAKRKATLKHKHKPMFILKEENNNTMIYLEAEVFDLTSSSYWKETIVLECRHPASIMCHYSDLYQTIKNSCQSIWHKEEKKPSRQRDNRRNMKTYLSPKMLNKGKSDILASVQKPYKELLHVFPITRFFSPKNKITPPVSTSRWVKLSELQTRILPSKGRGKK